MRSGVGGISRTSGKHVKCVCVPSVKPRNLGRFTHCFCPRLSGRKLVVSSHTGNKNGISPVVLRHLSHRPCHLAVNENADRIKAIPSTMRIKPGIYLVGGCSTSSNSLFP